MEDHKNAKEAKVKLHEYKKKIGKWTAFLFAPVFYSILFSIGKLIMETAPPPILRKFEITMDTFDFHII